jgi:hypothetical protein
VDEAGLPVEQFLEGRDGAGALLRQRAAEGRRRVLGGGIADGAIGDAVEVLPRLVGHERDDRVELVGIGDRVGHAQTLPQRRRPSS